MNWNKKHNIIQNFPIGTIVMIKQPRQFNKFDLAYLGPYRIVSIGKNNTFKLADATGSILPRNFKKQQMKPVISEELTNHHYVEKILNPQNK